MISYTDYPKLDRVQMKSTWTSTGSALQTHKNSRDRKGPEANLNPLWSVCIILLCFDNIFIINKIFIISINCVIPGTFVVMTTWAWWLARPIGMSVSLSNLICSH
jgi:hypothetical protein